MEPIIPPQIEEVIAKFDRAHEVFDEGDVRQALIAVRETLGVPGEAENLGVWSEVLAFALASGEHGSSPWGTYFRPVGSGTTESGETWYFPDIAQTDAEVMPHWEQRARNCQHPVLKARYADLCWDMVRAIAKKSPNPEFARMAVDAYLASIRNGLRRSIHDEFWVAIRALDIAQMLRDAERIEAAKNALLTLHRKAIERGKGLWWKAFDRLIDDRNARLTEAERDQLVADLEALATRFSSTADPAAFDPHAAQSAAKRLTSFYRKQRKNSEAVRLGQLVAHSFEHAASLASPMLASAFLQTAVTAYRDAGLADDARRTRFAMEEKISASKAEMGTFTFQTEISNEDMEKFLASVVTGDIGSTFARIASAFVDPRGRLEAGMREIAQQAPLMATISQSVMTDRHVAASIGSVGSDPFGRLIHHTTQTIHLNEVWLTAALDRAREIHQLVPGHFVGWAMRSGLFPDPSLVAEGMEAWFADDFIKAVHVLIPQVEVALRGIAEKLGKPTTKAHPKIPGVSVAVNMGDLLYSPEITDALGPDITLNLMCLYVDPRGLNMRNDMAHGLLAADRMAEGMALKIVHTFLVLGIWEELAAARRKTADDSGPAD